MSTKLSLIFTYFGRVKHTIHKYCWAVNDAIKWRGTMYRAFPLLLHYKSKGKQQFGALQLYTTNVNSLLLELRCWLAQIITNNMHKLSTYYIIMTIFMVPIDFKCCPAFNNDCIMFCWLQYVVKSINTLSPYSAELCNYPPEI